METGLGNCQTNRRAPLRVEADNEQHGVRNKYRECDTHTALERRQRAERAEDQSVRGEHPEHERPVAPHLVCVGATGYGLAHRLISNAGPKGSRVRYYAFF